MKKKTKVVLKSNSKGVEFSFHGAAMYLWRLCGEYEKLVIILDKLSQPRKGKERSHDMIVDLLDLKAESLSKAFLQFTINLSLLSFGDGKEVKITLPKEIEDYENARN